MLEKSYYLYFFFFTFIIKKVNSKRENRYQTHGESNISFINSKDYAKIYQESFQSEPALLMVPSGPEKRIERDILLQEDLSKIHKKSNIRYKGKNAVLLKKFLYSRTNKI